MNQKIKRYMAWMLCALFLMVSLPTGAMSEGDGSEINIPQGNSADGENPLGVRAEGSGEGLGGEPDSGSQDLP